MSRRPINLTVLIDALGWRYLENKSFLDGWLPYRRPLRTILGFSSGAIPTILTGLPPSITGHWNLLYYDPDDSPFHWMRYFQFLPYALMENRITRRLVREVGRRFLGMGPGFECCVSPRLLPLFNWVEKKNIYHRGGINGAQSIFDVLAQAKISSRAYSYHDSTDSEIFRHAEADLKNSDATFFFIYLCEMDMFLHLHCLEPAKIKTKLEWYEHNLQKLFELARAIDPEARLTLTSDHGMTPVRNHYDLIGQLEPLGLQMPKDYLAVFDSTMARFWFFTDGAYQKINNAFKDLPCGGWLDDEQLKSAGVYFDDRRFGERIFLLHPGWLLSRSDFNGAGWMPAGMHGYHPDDSYSDAIFLASHPPSFEPQTIADVYPHMRETAQRQSLTASGLGEMTRASDGVRI
jgi:type I phosphodiesterase/nucleotide pyrophosphatase